MKTDVTVVCVECGVEFNWSAGDQNFYAERGLTPPKRCKPCRAAKKKRIERQHGAPYTYPVYRK